MTFSERLKDYRQRRGWKDVTVIAEKTGIPVHNLWAWEAQRRTPPIWLQEMLFRDLDRVGLP